MQEDMHSYHCIYTPTYHPHFLIKVSARKKERKMLALSPTLFSTAYGWTMENLITQNLHQDCNHDSNEFEENSYYSLLDFPTYDQIQQDFAPDNSMSISSGGAINGNIGDCIKLSKKLNHNASERGRRKKVNDLYAFLRSLLPISKDQKKKVSIPRTVSRALKYIPELQKEIETLILKKEKLSSYSSAIANTSQVHLGIKKQRAKKAIIQRKSPVVSSVSALGEKEAMIQLISSNDHMSKNKEIGFLSKVLEFLEYEEDGLVMLNSTTLKCSGEGMLLNTFHLQVQGDKKIEVERLKEKLCSFYQQSDQIAL